MSNTYTVKSTMLKKHFMYKAALKRPFCIC